MFGLNPDKITKDTLYKGAHDLWRVHKGMEDFLHRRVCSMFDIDERILLFDLTNTYFEGRMEDSELCRRSLLDKICVAPGTVSRKTPALKIRRLTH